MTDAIGNEIIIGNSYGFSRNKSGVNIIKLGVVVGKTDTGFASLKIKEEFQSVYDERPELMPFSTYQKVKVKSFMLFPIPTNRI